MNTIIINIILIKRNTLVTKGIWKNRKIPPLLLKNKIHKCHPQKENRRIFYTLISDSFLHLERVLRLAVSWQNISCESGKNVLNKR